MANIGFILRGAGFIAGGAILWLIYFNLKDRLRPEPRLLLVLAFILGGLSAVAGLAAYGLAVMTSLPAEPGGSAGEILFYCLAVVGPIEEGVKFLFARAFIFRLKHFDEPIDGIVYAAAVAVGFASFENLIYLPHLAWPEQLARALASPLTHSLFAAIWGFGVSRAFFSSNSRAARLSWQLLTLLASMLLHGLYDFFLLASGATFIASGIALVLWLSLIAYARHATR
jgi:RsiW-degrading membrane proteinase PrsW (M82 family)